MYGSVVFVFGIILVLLSPVIWVAWWLVADLGERRSGSSNERHETWEEQARRAA